ncbi:hypothetical protein L1987_59275 [Smallanthus sonchifolius]|uniref:Uncharacterized protein n=1 Tax=Smallanthus sonchifolius TaxID=185202 RepID=A0ACB9D520_9ASTR|nr:hypothetical protein L1987_59275 [Smallanthus sonchifolius]
MPSGAKKRKAAKKKKVNDSSTPNPHQGESDGGELSSPTLQDQDPSVEVVKRADSSSEKKSNNGNEEEGNIEIETVSKSKNSSGSSSSSSDSSDEESHVVDKNVVVVESAPAVESLVETISPVVDPVKPVDSLLEEVSQVCDEVKNEGKTDLVVEETVVVEEEQTVDDCEKKDDSAESSVVVESVLKENEVEKVQALVEKVASESRDDVSSSTPPKEVISDVNGADCADEIETVEHSDRQKMWRTCSSGFDSSSSAKYDLLEELLWNIRVVFWICAVISETDHHAYRAMGLLVMKILSEVARCSWFTFFLYSFLS